MKREGKIGKSRGKNMSEKDWMDKKSWYIEDEPSSNGNWIDDDPDNIWLRKVLSFEH